jgi:prophage DNA circulation protein
MARNWPATLAPASFRGVPFFVKTEGLADAARFVAVHTYVDSEDHDTEDMGRKPRRYRISGYVASDTADADMLALASACGDASDDGELVLPLNGVVTVKCTDFSSSGEKDSLGYIACTMDFVESVNPDGLAGSGFAATPIGDRLASDAADALGSIANTVISAGP